MAITHDGFFKSLLDEPGAAGALLRERLPPEVAAQLAPGEPELVHASFVDPALAQRHSDRLYRVRLLGGGVAFVYCLVEHKSSCDPRVALQLLVYLTRVFERLAAEVKAPGPLPPVIALVVYHGRKPWSAPARFTGLLAGGAELKHQLLDFPVHVLDVGFVPEATLSRHRVLAVGLLLMKYAMRTDKGEVVETMTALLLEMRGLPRGTLERFWRYISSRYEAADRKAIQRALRRTMPDKEEHMISIAAKEWRAEGKAEGRAEGRAEAKAETLVRQLEKKFGELPSRYAAKVSRASVEQLDEWLDRILDASTLPDVFAGRSH